MMAFTWCSTHLLTLKPKDSKMDFILQKLIKDKKST